MMSVGARNFDPIGLASASNCADLDYSPHELSPSDKETSCLPHNISSNNVLMGFCSVVFGIRLLLASCAHHGREDLPAILDASLFLSRRLLLL
ncbi:hypothetical protein RHSIM_Rhsim03G0270600 [Rhododendron simsii]|uniref:Uncharacterized protein n=1 Tax=Rhododendron simsii TaxID=118357 RepID=A0A834LUM3_RHOSS|nr:hypothetical protein RHSIM_Rhsim03G0270600 [Rhododendron simsii]